MNQNRSRNRGLELGVILLFSELFQVGYDKIPPVTLFTIVGQALLYIDVFDVPWSKWDACISGNAILKSKDYKRLLLNTIEHGDDMHLYYNMISFLIKGRSLEKRYGSSNFAILLSLIAIMTSALYVALAIVGARFDPDMMKSCAIGFSGVIFALKVITTREEAPGSTIVSGLLVPSQYAVWLELVLIHLLVPNSSFMGHLAGLLAGLLYTSTFVGTIIDKTIGLITGRTMYHRYEQEYHERQSSYNPSYSEDSSSSNGGYTRTSYGWRQNFGYR